MLKLKLYFYRGLSLSCILLGIVIGHNALTQENDGFPFKEKLSERSGFIDRIEKYKYGIKFKFSDGDRNFNYPSKSRGQGVVWDALVASKGKEVTILYKSDDSNSPVYSKKRYHDVFEIKVNERMVRSYSESEKSWKSDNKLTPMIVVLFLLGGPCIWWKYGR